MIGGKEYACFMVACVNFIFSEVSMQRVQSLSHGINFSCVDGLPTFTLPKPLYKSSDVERIALERLCNLIPPSFEKVFGVSDYTRWMLLEQDKTQVQFIAGKASTDVPNNENDIARKIAGMLYMLKNGSALKLDEEARALESLLYLTQFLHIAISMKKEAWLNSLIKWCTLVN
jgi:hypothetical protein